MTVFVVRCRLSSNVTEFNINLKVNRLKVTATFDTLKVSKKKKKKKKNRKRNSGTLNTGPPDYFWCKHTYNQVSFLAAILTSATKGKQPCKQPWQAIPLLQ